MRRLLVAVLAVLSVSLVGLQPASADTYPPCTITGTASSETLTGTSGNDVICTGGGNDTVFGLAGDDVIVAETGNLTVDAGDGNDTVYGAAASDLTVTAGSGDDTVYGSPGDDTISGGDGSDTVIGGAGADNIDGGLGEDNLSGGSGNDSITGEVGNDSLTGESGNDTLNGGLGDDSISGGDGNDQITGEADIDTITGGEGDDTINAGDGNDDVDAGNGNDSITGGEGNDDINGDAGNDTITGNTGDDTINGGGANDTLNGASGDDSIIGGSGADNLDGGEGNDNLEGSTGNDTLFGRSGEDVLWGSDGDDLLAGGENLDKIDGGPGLNTCDYNFGETLTSSCRYDDSPPALVSVSFDREQVEVGSSMGVVAATVHVTDQTKISMISLSCSNVSAPAGLSSVGNTLLNLNSDNYYSFPVQGGSWTLNEHVGTSKDLTAVIELGVPLGGAPGKWSCTLGAHDTLGHYRYYSSDEGYLPSLTVTRTPAGLSSEPTNLAFSPSGKTDGTLSWSSPEYLGSPALYAYLVQYSTDGTKWVDAPSGGTSAASIQIAGLKADTDYWFRVRGENGGTVGQDTTFMNLNWAEIKVTMPAATAPTKPSDFASSSVTSSGFSLAWGVPSDDGGLPVTDFRVEVSRDNGQSWQSVKGGVSTSTSLTVSGAAPGTTYLVRVAAVNSVGQSEWLMGSVTTLATSATAPRNLAVVGVLQDRLSLVWNLPESNGGTGITDYRVEVTSNGSTEWTVIPHAASNSLGFNLTNLLAGRTYLFRVAAVTSFGVGAYSNVVTVTTAGAVTANAPATLVVSNLKTSSVSLSWIAVTATQKVSNYLVDVSLDGSSWVTVSKRVSTSTSLALSGLKPGTTYQVRVAAVNSVGVGEYRQSSFTTLATVSSSPSGSVSSNLSSSGFTLNWNAPASTGGAAITDYLVEVNGGGYAWANLSAEVSANNTLTISGLYPAVKYSVRVKAVNSVGVSKASTTLYVSTLPTAPGTVTALTVKSVTATSAAITWTAPNTGGARISDYLAEYSTDNGQTWKTVVKSASSSTNLTLKGLKTKTSYLVRVTAKNSVGYGLSSSSLILTTP